MKEYTLVFTENEVGLVAKGLQEMPYRIVAPLLLKISNQIKAAEQSKVDQEPI